MTALDRSRARTRRGAARRRWLAVVCAGLVGVGSGPAWAAFTATTSTGAGAFSAGAPDTTAPVVARSTVARESAVPAASIVAGRFRQNAGYRVYSQVTDDVGVAAVTADTTGVGGGSTTTPLSTTGGPFTVGGQSYNFRSAVLTAADVAQTGVTRTFTVTAADAGANSVTTGAQNATAETYAQAVASTGGIAGHWPLGSATGTTATVYREADFAAADGTQVTAYTTPQGMTFTAPNTFGTVQSTIYEVAGDPVVRLTGGAGYVENVAQYDPPSANYRVEADVILRTDRAGDEVGVMGRRVSNAGAARYGANYVSSADAWQLVYCSDIDTCSVLQSVPRTLVPGRAYRLGLQMVGTTISMLVDDAVVATATSGALTATSRSGVRFKGNGTSNTTGLHLDDFAIESATTRTTPAVAGSAPSGQVVGGATVGAAGAIADDTGTAMTFDGTDDGVRVARAPENGYVVADDFTLEAWFRSSAGASASDPPIWFQTRAIVDATSLLQDDFGTGLAATGRVIAGTADDSSGSYDASVVDGGASPTWADGAWHHMVFTRVRSTGAISLYVDGVLRAYGASGPTETLVSSPFLAFGVNADRPAGTYFLGTLDEVAVYSSALSADQVADHYAAGRGTG